jgi:phage-related protein
LEGNRDSTGIITMLGSRTNTVITKGSSVLTFAYALTAGNTITIDLNKRTVIRNGTENLRDKVTVTGGWPVLNPGNNVFTIGGTGSGVITVAARSAWR